MSNDGQDWAARQDANLFGIHRLADNGTVLEKEFGTANLVAPLRAAENTPDDRFDISIDPLALIPEVPTNNTAWVDPVEGDDLTGQVGKQTLPFATLPAALLAAKLEIPSAINPMLISLRPGIHETTPLDMSTAPYITLAGADGCETAVIEASTATSPIVTSGDGVVVKNVTLQGANGAGGIGVLMDTAGSMRVESCCIRDCETGIRSNHASSDIAMTGCVLTKAASETMDRGIEVLSGRIVADACGVFGEAGSLVSRAVAVSGSGSVLEFNFLLVTYAVSGIYAENNGTIRAQGARATLCTNGIHIAATNGFVNMVSSSSFFNTAEDVLVEGSTSFLIVASLAIEKPMSVQSGSVVFGTHLDAETFTIEGDTSIGTVARPAAISMGGGGIHGAGFRAWWNDNIEAGTWTDVTAALTSGSGSAIDMMPGIGVGNSLFVGGPNPAPGLWLDLTLAQVGGTVVVKYWNGAWTAIPRWMTTEGVFPHESSGNALLAETGRQNLRFDGITGEMSKAIGPGGSEVTGYWYLFEITSELTTVPKAERVRLQSDHTRINQTGLPEHFGAGEYRQLLPDGDVLPIDWHTSGVAPTGITILVTGNIQYPSYAFVDAQDRQINRAMGIPPGLDTSRPVVVEVEWDPGASTNTGDLRLVLRYATFKATDVVNGGVSESQSVVLQAGPGTQYEGVRSTHELYIPGVTSGHDTLALELQREGGDAADTFTGSARLRSIRVFGTFYKPGEQK